MKSFYNAVIHYHFDNTLKTEKKLYKEKTKFLWLIPRKKTKFFWVVLEAFSLRDENGIEVDTVPAGFKTDFSSIPFIFRGFFPKDDVDSQGAVFHDWLYHSNKPKSVVTKPIEDLMTREECDWWFLVAMRACGQEMRDALIKWRAVRRGGWYGWNRADKCTEEHIPKKAKKKHKK